MNTPVFHLEVTGMETEATTSVARQSVIENMTEGVEPLPLAGFTLGVLAVIYVLNKIKNVDGPLENIFEDKPYK